MVRNEERTIYQAIACLAGAVQEVLVLDTGSTDMTLQRILAAHDEFGNVQVFRCDCEDLTKWVVEEYEHFSRKLGEARNFLIRQAKTDFIWVVDGDEIYPNASVAAIVEFFSRGMNGAHACYVPIRWFYRNRFTLCKPHPRLYYASPRLLVRDGIRFVGSFPMESIWYGSQPVTMATSLFLRQAPMYHYEMVTKPHRRSIVPEVTRCDEQPEVFDLVAKKIAERDPRFSDNMLLL